MTGPLPVRKQIKHRRSVMGTLSNLDTVLLVAVLGLGVILASSKLKEKQTNSKFYRVRGPKKPTPSKPKRSVLDVKKLKFENIPHPTLDKLMQKVRRQKNDSQDKSFLTEDPFEEEFWADKKSRSKGKRVERISRRKV